MDDFEQADAVAFVLAHVRGDLELVEQQLEMHGVERLFPASVGLLLRLLADAGVDAAAVEDALTDWQGRRRETYGRWT